MSDKVFCKNCKHRGVNMCYKSARENVVSCKTKNANYNCPNYKPKEKPNA
jgi:hypothetical protein